MTRDKEIANLQKKITSLKEMKKNARLLQNKRIKLKIQLAQIRKALNTIRSRFSRYNIK
jgi:hypothetical protein